MHRFVQIGLSGVFVFGLCAATYQVGRVSAQSAQPAPQQGAAAYPRDIDPESRNRLPVVKRDELDALGKTLFDKTTADVKSGRSLAGFQGPNGITLHSSRVAEADQRKNDYLRFDSRLGRRHYEVAILVTARALNHQFEWAAHEPAALAAGVEPVIIDIIKNRRPLTGLSPKDAALIQLGREVMAFQTVRSETLAEALKQFGRQDLVDAVSVMGHYTGIAILLNAFDQQLAPGQKPLLPQ